MADTKIISDSDSIETETEKKSSGAMLELDIDSRFNGIYDDTSKAILAFITAKCGNTADISDIFQDTYMELYELIGRRGTGYVTDAKALVFRIAKRKIARHYSLRKRLKIFVSMSISIKNEAGEETELPELNALNLFLTEEFAVNQIMLDSAKQFIGRKPEDVKKIFYLFYDMDKSIPEIAKILKSSESNVKNKLYRTIKELRNLLN
jgi:RNA polymerase sigma-70 factor (ECF subfamily)